MKYVSVAEMIAVEKESDAAGHTYEKMMEEAGRGLAESVLDEYGFLEEKSVVALIGSGNNGGDALVALAYLAAEGWKVSAYVIRPRSENDPLVSRFVEAGGDLYHLSEDKNYKKLKVLISDHAVLMDGILGTGIRLPIKGEVAKVMGVIRKWVMDEMEAPPIVVAVDCPSGIDNDSGDAAPECLPADLTVTMAAIKQGLLKFPAANFVGDLRLVGIGLPDDGEGLDAWCSVKTFVPDIDWVRDSLPPRPLDAHKGTFGTALVVAGSVNFTGAAYLAGKAAYLAGAGLVTLAVPAPLHSALAGHFCEATWLLLPHEVGVIAVSASDIIKKNLGKVTSLLIGPGLGLEDTTKDFLSNLLRGGKRASGKIGFISSQSTETTSESSQLPPMVIDADGLKLLARIPDWFNLLQKNTVLTPHPGEMSVLTGLQTEEIQEGRLEIARRYSEEWDHVVVLKGAFTVVAAPDGQAAIIPIASPALARAGTGDVLAGLIAGLRAQGVDAFPAAVSAAWIHAHAGVLAAQQKGSSAVVLAGDVLSCTVNIISELS